MNNFGIAHFSLYVIDVWEYIFKVMFINAACIHKIEVFAKIYIREFNNIPLIFLFFTHFYF